MIRWIHELWLDLVNGFKTARRQRRMVEQARGREDEMLARRPRVVHAGGVSRRADGAFVVEQGWQFELEDGWLNPGMWNFYDMRGEWRYFGYTERELIEIHARRVEFNVDA